MIHRLLIFIKYCIIRIRYRKSLYVHSIPHLAVSTKITIQKHAKMIIGKRLTTFDHVYISVVSGICTIGDNSAINRNSIIVCRDSITIGEHCHIGPNVCIYDHDHRFGYLGIEEGYNCSPIIIQKGCWIGANVTILRGTEIGEYSIVGAGTVVKGCFPPHSIIMSGETVRIKSIIPNKEEQ